MTVNVLALLSGVASSCIVAVVVNAWLNRRKLEAEASEAWRAERATIVEEMGTEEILRRIRREQHAPRDAWMPRAPQDATPEQWAALQPQDRPACDHPETVEDIQNLAPRGQLVDPEDASDWGIGDDDERILAAQPTSRRAIRPPARRVRRVLFIEHQTGTSPTD